MNDNDMTLIAAAPLETRQRWFAEMNCWRAPADFPVALPSFEDHFAQSKDPTWRKAWDAVSASMSAAEMSLGWWLHELHKTEDEWRVWWNSRQSRSLA